MHKMSMMLGVIAALAAPAFAADDDAPAMQTMASPRGVPESGPSSNRAPFTPAAFAGPVALFAGVADSAAATQVFRFANGGRTAGTVTATLYDGAAGTSLGTWTSAAIPAGAAIEVTAAQVVSGLTATQRANPLNIAVGGAIRGTAQLLSKTATAIINQGGCAGGNGLGYVEGPGFTGVAGALRLLNGGGAAGTVTLSLRDAATGTELGKYTSASVPSKGAVTMTTAAIAAAATPVVPASTVALNVVPIAATARIDVMHLATVTASGVVSNLSAACGI